MDYILPVLVQESSFAVCWRVLSDNLTGLWAVLDIHTDDW